MDKLDYDKLFSIAIEREISAHEFYKEVAERVSNQDAKDVFTQLAKEELGHQEILEKYKTDPTMVMKFNAPLNDYKVAEATEDTELSIDMIPKDAINLAMKKELEAVDFYKRLADDTDDLAAQEIFKNLANMELRHKHRLENVFVQIGYPEAF